MIKDRMTPTDRGYVESLRAIENKIDVIQNCLDILDKYVPKPLPWWEALAQAVEQGAATDARYTPKYVADMIRHAGRENT